TGECRGVDLFRLAGVQRVGADVLVAVVRGGGAVVEEVPAAALHRGHPAGVAAGVGVGGLAQPANEPRPAIVRRLEVAVRTEGRDDATGPGVVGRERGVRGQGAAGIV